jgi:hypothetical protein
MLGAMPSQGLPIGPVAVDEGQYIVCGRVIWHLGYTEDASAAVLTQSYGVFQRAALQQEPSYRVRDTLTDGFDSTVPITSPLRLG